MPCSLLRNCIPRRKKIWTRSVQVNSLEYFSVWLVDITDVEMRYKRPPLRSCSYPKLCHWTWPWTGEKPQSSQSHPILHCSSLSGCSAVSVFWSGHSTKLIYACAQAWLLCPVWPWGLGLTEGAERMKKKKRQIHGHTAKLGFGRLRSLMKKPKHLEGSACSL